MSRGNARGCWADSFIINIDKITVFFILLVYFGTGNSRKKSPPTAWPCIASACADVAAAGITEFQRRQSDAPVQRATATPSGGHIAGAP